MNHTISGFDATERTVTLQFDGSIIDADFVIGGQLPEIVRLRAENAALRKALENLSDTCFRFSEGDEIRELIKRAEYACAALNAAKL